MINFTNIKGETVEGQRKYFEQLVCHLARLEGGPIEFRRIEGAGGDGGVEAIRLLPKGRKIGYQAKFYPDRNRIDWNNINDSVRTALTLHRELDRYVIALPYDFTGKKAVKGGFAEGDWGKWDTRVKGWEAEASARGMSVEFEPWTAFEIENALMRADAASLLRVYFDRLTFTQEWMARNLERTVHDLQARYSPEEHVNTEGLKVLDVIYHRENVRRDLRAVFEAARCSDPRAAIALVESSGETEPQLIGLEELRSNFLTPAGAVDWGTDKPWPVCEWFLTWHLFTRSLNDIHNLMQKCLWAMKSSDHDDINRRLAETTRIYELIGPEVFGGSWSRLLPAEGSRAVLLIGRAGAGKSHGVHRTHGP